MPEAQPGTEHSVSVVVPVYQGERTLPALLAELAPLAEGFVTPDGHRARVGEILLVHDCGPDRSDEVIRDLAERYEQVRPVWLSRNFGQHPATLAGMASSGGDWIVTMDEDGQHDPADLPSMLDTALRQRADLVYAAPVNAAPHGVLRNLQSWAAKRLLAMSSAGSGATRFNSYRLVLGEIGRSVAAYAGSGVYLDVALGWVTRRVVTSPVTLRTEGDRPSGYSTRRLVAHFWRMVLTSGTGYLRLVSVMGGLCALAGVLLSLYVVLNALFWNVDLPAGWTTLIVVMLLTTGAILFSLGVIAEYIGVSVNMALGKPLYLILTDPVDGPLGQAGRRQSLLPAPGVPDRRSRAAERPRVTDDHD